MKFTNFPRVTYMSFKESVSARNSLLSQLESRGIFNHKMIERYDGKSENYHNSRIVTGPYINSLSSEVIAATMSNIKAIHDWYTSTSDEIGFFCEDDIKFDMVDYWKFTWNEVLAKLPHDWKILQLATIRSVPFVNNDMKLHMRKWDDWSCRAYILKRSHAEQILKDYYQNGIFTLDVKNTNHVPLPENVIYTKDHRQTYTIPLFTENRKDKIEAMKGNVIPFEEKAQNDSYNFITGWWKETGSKLDASKVFNHNTDSDVIDMHNDVLISEKIPVIGTAVVNNVSWVTRLLNSVDYPVENFVIINNNGKGELDKELDDLANTHHKFIDKIKVVHMPANIGCAGAWNLIIKCYMNAPYWIITNDDVAFKTGLLQEMNNIALSDNEFGTIHPNAGDFDIGAWDLFLIHERAVQALGLFDENTYPAYCEDADYIMRMSNAGMKKIVGLKNTYLHGTGESKDYYVHGRQTEKSNPKLKELLLKANSMNIEYLTRKWGPGWRKVDPSKVPFESEERDISYSIYDLKFVRGKYTGF